MAEVVAGEADLHPGDADGGKLGEALEVGVGVEAIRRRVAAGGAGEGDIDRIRSSAGGHQAGPEVVEGGGQRVGGVEGDGAGGAG